MTLVSEILEITLRSLFISGLAAYIALLVGLPVGVIIGLKSFRGRSILKGILNGMMALPGVALGLILYLLLSSSGPAGFLQLLYSPWAIIIGQAILIFPLMVSLTTETVESVNPAIRELALTLGANEIGANIAVVRESLSGILLAVSASFSRAISELAVALMLGGNIVGFTRILTTSIALETARGELALGIGLAAVLLVIILTFNIGLQISKKRVRWWLWE